MASFLCFEISTFVFTSVLSSIKKNSCYERRTWFSSSDSFVSNKLVMNNQFFFFSSLSFRFSIGRKKLGFDRDYNFNLSPTFRENSPSRRKFKHTITFHLLTCWDNFNQNCCCCCYTVFLHKRGNEPFFNLLALLPFIFNYDKEDLKVCNLLWHFRRKRTRFLR